MKIKILTILTLNLILTLFWGCEKEFDNVIENQNSYYQVVSVVVKDSLQYPIDSTAIFKIEFNASDGIKNVSFDIYSPENEKINSPTLYLLDNGNPANGDADANDDIYSAKINLDSNSLNGNYELKYFVTDDFNIVKQVATSKYYFNNGKSNVAPVISNLILVDSINVGTSFIFSVFASDANGYSDIKDVNFELYRPDSTLVTDGNGNSKFKMYDDGNLTVYGDQVAGDGIFSFKNSFLDAVSTQRGFWRFEFEAKDWGNKLSNKIIKLVKVI